MAGAIPLGLRGVPSSRLEALAGATILAAAKDNIIRFYRTKDLVDTLPGERHHED